MGVVDLGAGDWIRVDRDGYWQVLFCSTWPDPDACQRLRALVSEKMIRPAQIGKQWPQGASFGIAATLEQAIVAALGVKSVTAKVERIVAAVETSASP